MSWILALGIGLMAGYGAVEGRGGAMIVAALALVLLPVLYYRRGRLPDIGLLFIGLGALPALLLGPNLLDSLRGPGTGADASSWPLFLAACILLVAGVVILVTLSRRPREGG
jgi:hypothetical protein